MLIQINPIEINRFNKSSINAEFLEITSMSNFVKNESCDVQIQLFTAKRNLDENNQVISVEKDEAVHGEIIHFVNPDYSSWIDDDTMIDFILSEIGASRLIT
jgi:hypothetical protein